MTLFEKNMDVVPDADLASEPIWYHSTDAEGRIGRFTQSEVWFESQPMPGYGERDIPLIYPIRKPFVTTHDEYRQEDYGATPEEAERNRDEYRRWGGEGDPRSFQNMRDLGYDTLIDDEGFAGLYPERAMILAQDMVEKDGMPDRKALLDIYMGDKPRTVSGAVQCYTGEARTATGGRTARIPRAPMGIQSTGSHAHACPLA
jgi:hypothetical protein